MAERIEILDVVGRLHAGVVDPDAWRTGLDGVSDLLDGAGLMFISVLAGRSGYATFGHRLPEAALALAAGPCAVPDPAINPWFAALPWLGRQRVVTTDDIGRDLAQTSRTWREAMVPNGIVPGPSAVLERLPERIDINMTFRGLGAPEATARRIDVYRRLVPHLARALRVRHDLETLHSLAESALDALDLLARGVVLTAPDGSLRFANRAARAILSDADGLRSVGGKIEAPRVRSRSALDALIWNASQTGIGAASNAVDAVSIERPSGRTPYAVVAEPLAPAHNERLGEPGREGAILFLSDPERIGRPPPARLALLYGLTVAEAEIASRLAQGERRAGIAAALGVSAHTVKTHQIAIFDKLEVHGQVDLVRRIAADVGDIAPAG